MLFKSFINFDIENLKSIIVALATVSSATIIAVDISQVNGVFKIF